MDSNEANSAYCTKRVLSQDASVAGFDEVQQEAQTEAQKEAESRNFAASPIIMISVGKEKVTYRMHKATLVKKSTFFAKIFASGMMESQTHEVSLPEDDLETFERFASWIYGQDDTESTDDNSKMIMKCWALADKYGVPMWQDQLITKLMDHWIPHGIPICNAAWVLDNVSSETPLSKLAIDRLAWDMRKSPPRYFKDGETEMVQDLDLLLSRHDFPLSNFLHFALLKPFLDDGYYDPPGSKGCTYHAHGGDIKCPVANLPG
ncbi:uncharacterized protein Z520_01381 [Fonsecaea multimorphosa CBS 102226]|uniref:BTB domain-containing protein n=1 Tax=Fonsecaea multimorphosa CBS 102226 TaxID=1442371 RepID=A0A0D2HM45_9EURO|nr:uncharacterized protein Z520_01381 [Fonsecaea multimorphosa CBS 102226]KIY02916.1 hypothetical protein Z520_01381 [Fonsecaea multimorphosa CBS 102226]OAL30750.1 hypothetical protein AYO22_01370 [Fonsecaea multimorphosa]